AQGVAPARAYSSTKYRRTLAHRLWQQQRNVFEQAANSSSDSTERRRSNHNRRSSFKNPAADRDFRSIQNEFHATNSALERRCPLLATRRGSSRFYSAQPPNAERGFGCASRSMDPQLQGDHRKSARDN